MRDQTPPPIARNGGADSGQKVANEDPQFGKQRSESTLEREDGETPAGDEGQTVDVGGERQRVDELEEGGVIRKRHDRDEEDQNAVGDDDAQRSSFNTEPGDDLPVRILAANGNVSRPLSKDNAGRRRRPGGVGDQRFTPRDER